MKPELKPLPRQKCDMVIGIDGPDGKRTAYTVRPIKSEIPEHRRAYQVRKVADRTVVYHIAQEASGRRVCDCGAGSYRDGSCKHARALAALGLFLSTREIAALNRMESSR